MESSLKFFLLKVKARCNINCTYCYEYNLSDTSWLSKPGTMSFEVVRQTAERIRKHTIKNSLNNITIAFHGGEPLLLKPQWYIKTCEIFSELLPRDLEINYGLQTNGTLLNNEFLDTFLKLNIKVSVSLDGTREANDKYRIDFNGNSTFERTLKGISLLNSEKYKSINAGILTVINPCFDGETTYDFITSLGINSIDFLYPHYNHSSLPPFKSGDIAAWLIKIFDKWWENNCETSIRIFEDSIHLILGGKYSVENLGLAPVELLVIQSDGSYEAVDSLKSTFDGAVSTGSNVFQDDFEVPLSKEFIKMRLDRANELCSDCKSCEFVNVCGGGYLPHRYKKENYFDNPSVYCQDLKTIFSHIKSVLIAEIPSLENIINNNLFPLNAPQSSMEATKL